MIALPTDLEDLIRMIERLSQDELILLLKNINAPFPVDFTDSFLRSLPIERLKHLTLAVCLQVRKHHAAA